MDSREIFGAEIQYFRQDPRFWETTIQRLKDSGLRCVTTYVQWGTHLVGEPDRKHRAGVLDFTGRTQPRLNLLRFLELVEKHGLNLNFRCGPFCCNEMVHGGYPPWLVLGDPGMMVWDWQNRTTQGYWIGRKEGSQPSYLHPEYLAWCARWLAEVDKLIVPHLKVNGGCITMLNLDNEISYIVRDGFLDSDYNPINVAPGGYYHRFLKAKYGKPGKLPYGRPYAAFEDVPAPRAVPATVGEELAYYTDWCEFKTWVMCEYIRRLRALHEENGVRDVTFMTNFNPHLPEGVPTRMPEFEKAVGPGGVTGYDFYRGAFMSYSGYQSMARVLKLMNASVRYTWSAEFMAGTWNKDLTKASRISDDHLRFMARCALAQGCKSIDWFMFHDRDCWGDAPVSSHGQPRPSLAVLREIPELLFGKIKDWDGLVPQTDVGIVYDLAQHQHTYLSDPMPCNDQDIAIGAPRIDGVEAGRASLEYVGLFRLVEQAGAQAGALDLVHSAAGLAACPLVFLPGSPVTHSAVNVALTAYVKNGGVVVLSGPWPGRDETGWPATFLGMAQPPQRGQDRIVRPIGKGRLIWLPAFIAQEKAEEERLESVATVRELIDAHVGDCHVRLRPVTEVSWVDWQAGGGHRPYTQPRNLGSAVLHRNRRETILFVLNHYVEPAEFELTFPQRTRAAKLVNLSTGAETVLRHRKAIVDIDRKCAEIFAVR